MFETASRVCVCEFVCTVNMCCVCVSCVCEQSKRSASATVAAWSSDDDVMNRRRSARKFKSSPYARAGAAG